MTDRVWGSMLLANAFVASFLTYVIFIENRESTFSISRALDLASEAGLVCFGILVGSNALATALLGVLLLAAVPAARIAAVVSVAYLILFSLEAVVGGFPILYPMAAFSGVSAWRLRHGPASRWLTGRARHRK